MSAPARAAAPRWAWLWPCHKEELRVTWAYFQAKMLCTGTPPAPHTQPPPGSQPCPMCSSSAPPGKVPQPAKCPPWPCNHCQGLAAICLGLCTRLQSTAEFRALCSAPCRLEDSFPCLRAGNGSVPPASAYQMVCCASSTQHGSYETKFFENKIRGEKPNASPPGPPCASPALFLSLGVSKKGAL